MGDQHRAHAIDLARLGLVARNPDLAVVVADLADQMVDKLWRGLVWATVGMVIALVAWFLLAVAASWDAFAPSMWGGAGGVIIGVIVQIHNVDSGRRRNLARARAAGLLD